MAEFLKYYEILLKKATVDFYSAQKLYEDFQQGDSELDIEVIMFHLQQGAEKSLKSILSFTEIYFPKVHDLEVLIQLIENNNIPLKIDSDLLIELSDFAVEGRYSVIHDDLVDAEKYFEATKELFQQVKKLISKTSTH